MENLIFRKGALIEKSLKKNVWILHFMNMSGDGDHYEEETIEEIDYADIIGNIIIYATRWTMTGDIYNDNKILEAADAKGIELGMKPGVGHDLYMDITGPDVTTDGQYQAVPDECWITWFDEDGYEHVVEIVKGNGKVFHKINESNIKEVLNED